VAEQEQLGEALELGPQQQVLGPALGVQQVRVQRQELELP
jgi:hypothetical protein